MANKFYPLNNKALRERFGTVSSNKTSTGIKYEKNSYLIDVESLGKNNEFSKLLQFINTPQGMEGGAWTCQVIIKKGNIVSIVYIKK
ncbi:hypothetical protein [Howardella ureilytica]